MTLPSKPTPTRLQQGQSTQSFDQLSKSLAIDVTQLAQVSAYLKTLAQMVDRVRVEVSDADKPLRVGTREANPFADPRAGEAASGENVVDTLGRNTASVHNNVRGSLDDLQTCLKNTAAAMDRVAKSVHDNSQDNTKRLQQQLDAAFNPQSARPSGQTPHTPPLRPAPKASGGRRA
ncbi:hypothetical protein GCM10023322_27920 [Rugosimonospora acidiphila]|uniref:Uncharacterized protein n=1 Tax=Rugosimonospora acidiphila TaxID=556531 RepID=A0ABP9RQW5_9ACTN